MRSDDDVFTRDFILLSVPTAIGDSGEQGPNSSLTIRVGDGGDGVVVAPHAALLLSCSAAQLRTTASVEMCAEVTRRKVVPDRPHG
jgi:hypothetical protein